MILQSLKYDDIREWYKVIYKVRPNNFGTLCIALKCLDTMQIYEIWRSHINLMIDVNLKYSNIVCDGQCNLGNTENDW